MRLGLHVSVAGGVDLAVERGVALKCDAIQIFNKNNNQWKAFAITQDVVARYKMNLKNCDIHPVVSHASYLINLATSDQPLWEKSRDSFAEELAVVIVWEFLISSFIPAHTWAWARMLALRGWRRR